MKGSVIRLSPRMCFMFPVWALTGWWAIRLSLWQRTPSGLPLPPRNTAPSSSPTAQRRAACWNIRTWSRTRAGALKLECGVRRLGKREQGSRPRRRHEIHAHLHLARTGAVFGNEEVPDRRDCEDFPSAAA